MHNFVPGLYYIPSITMNSKPCCSELNAKNTFINGFERLFSDRNDEKSLEFRDLKQSFPEVVFSQDVLEVTGSKWSDTFKNMIYIMENMPSDADLELKEYSQVLSTINQLLRAKEQFIVNEYQVFFLISNLYGRTKTLRGKIIVNFKNF